MVADSSDNIVVDISDIDSCKYLQIASLNNWDYPIFEAASLHSNCILSKVSYTTVIFDSSPEHNMLVVSYCDGPVSIVCGCLSSIVINFLKPHLLNHKANCTEMILTWYIVQVVQRIKCHWKLWLMFDNLGINCIF